MQIPLIAGATMPGLLAISFEVAGSPVAQGSKTARIVGERVRVKGVPAVLRPKAALIELSDMKTKTMARGRLTAWRERVRARAIIAMASHELAARPVRFSAEFVIPRPKSHYTGAGALTKAARRRVPPLDLSKLVRAVEDALTGVVYRDDVQILQYGPTSKRYAAAGGSGGVRVAVEELACSV